MLNDEGLAAVIVICIIVLTVLFGGEPDIVDAIVYKLMGS